MSSRGSQGFLLDTSVLSALAPSRPAISPALTGWFRQHSAQLFIPCIVVAELEQGIRKLHWAGSTKRAARLATWLDGLLLDYAERVLPLDGPVSRLTGQIAERALAAGTHPGFPDVAIAAIAQHRDLSLLTCNLRHFKPLAVRCINPFDSLPQ